MREIKYRFWHEEVKRMLYEAQRQNIQELLDHNRPLMQFTGLKDRNGKDGYYKDIVTFHHQNDTGYWVVEWDDIEARWILKSKLYGEITLRLIKETEIVGNIYETPELLGAGK